MSRLIQVTRAGGVILELEVDTPIIVDAEDIQSCAPAGEEDCGNTVICFRNGSMEFITESVNEINRLVMLHLDYAQSSATLRARSGQGLHTQTALAICSVIAAIPNRLLKRKQKLPR